MEIIHVVTRSHSIHLESFKQNWTPKKVLRNALLSRVFIVIFYFISFVICKLVLESKLESHSKIFKPKSWGCSEQNVIFFFLFLYCRISIFTLVLSHLKFYWNFWALKVMILIIFSWLNFFVHTGTELFFSDTDEFTVWTFFNIILGAIFFVSFVHFKSHRSEVLWKCLCDVQGRRYLHYWKLSEVFYFFIFSCFIERFLRASFLLVQYSVNTQVELEGGLSQIILFEKCLKRKLLTNFFFFSECHKRPLLPRVII